MQNCPLSISFWIAAKYLKKKWTTNLSSTKWQSTLVFLPGKSYGPGAWWATVHGVAKSQTQLYDWTRTHFFCKPPWPKALPSRLTATPALHQHVLSSHIPHPAHQKNLQISRPLSLLIIVTLSLAPFLQRPPSWHPGSALCLSCSLVPTQHPNRPRGIRVPARSTLSSSQSHCPQYRHLPSSLLPSLHLLFHLISLLFPTSHSLPPGACDELFPLSGMFPQDSHMAHCFTSFKALLISPFYNITSWI